MKDLMRHGIDGQCAKDYVDAGITYFSTMKDLIKHGIDGKKAKAFVQEGITRYADMKALVKVQSRVIGP